MTNIKHTLNEVPVAKFAEYAELGSARFPDHCWELYSHVLDFHPLKKKKQIARLVSFAKTMLFLLPNLCPVMDGKYTKRFYCGNVILEAPQGELDFYGAVFADHRQFAAKHASKLNNLIDSERNRNIPKIIDNIIIGQ